MKEKFDALEARIAAAQRKRMIDLILLALMAGLFAGVAAYVVIDKMKGSF